MTLQTMVFDMGNVLTFFSHQRMCEQIGQVCGVSSQAIEEYLIHSHLQWDFERGKLTAKQFHALFENQFEKQLDFKELCLASGDIFTLNTSMMPVLESLKNQGLRLVLLSNTCSTHIDRIRAQWDFLDLFDDLVLSYEVGTAKPADLIYEITLSRIQCPPEKALYTDDIQEYVECGRRAGMQAVPFTTTEKYIQDLKNSGLHV